MPLTSRDETDLLLPLLGGAHEAPPFATFLERLRRRTRMVSVSLTIRTGEGREPVALFVGPDIRARAHELDLAELNLTDRIQYDRLRPGRVYSGDEFDDHDLERKGRRARDMRKLGLVDERVVRLLAEETSAWLILASERPCTAADGALLSNLAPYVAAAVRSFVIVEAATLAAVVDGDALRRAGSGWIVFDKAARVLALAPATEKLLTDTFGHVPLPGQRLRLFGAAVDRALGEAASRFLQDPASSPRTQLLSAQPRIEAILTPWREGRVTVLEAPAMVAHCRHPARIPPRAAEHFAQLHELPRREAELAVLLAAGHSLAEAGQALGLTIETIRNYSKRLFVKVGARKQAELVRSVYASCAMLA
jgi:DNA-binding CsgD family transcriptional regulator